MSASALEGVLRDAGLRCRVEARDRLAVLILDPGAAAGGAALAALREQRTWITAQARALGFTHVALEIAESAPGAAVPRA